MSASVIALTRFTESPVLRGLEKKWTYLFPVATTVRKSDLPATLANNANRLQAGPENQDLDKKIMGQKNDRASLSGTL